MNRVTPEFRASQTLKALMQMEQSDKIRLAQERSNRQADAMFRIVSLKRALAQRLASKPETGEQWAEICRIEAEIVELQKYV